MKKTILVWLSASCLFCLIFFVESCSKPEFEPYNLPFFNINVDNKDTVTIKSNRKETISYNVNLSGELQYTSTLLEYKVIIGSGLVEGRDFNLATKSNTLNFVPGMMQRPVVVEWLANSVDPAKDNSLIIKLESNNKNLAIGVPGPANRQHQLVIIKTN